MAIEQLSDNAYKFNLADDVIEIGDVSKNFFRPYVKLTRWNRQASLSLYLPDTVSGTFISADADKVAWGNNLLELNISQLPPKARAYEGGGIELNIILKAKPPTNKIVFGIDLTDLVAHYQAPQGADGLATEWTNERGIVSRRAINVNGSYAFYYANRAIWGDLVHKSGKAFHWYKPELIDAAGNRCWADLNISSGLAAITIPQNFLNRAKYPIQHAAGATIGKTTVGGTWSAWHNEIDTGKYTCGTAGSYAQMWVVIDSNGGKGYAGIYSDVSGPAALLATSADCTINTLTKILISGSDYWYKFPFAAPVSLTATTAYHLAVLTNTSAGSYAWDTVTNIGTWKTVTYGALPDPLTGEAASDAAISMYAETGGASQTGAASLVGIGTFTILGKELYAGKGSLTGLGTLSASGKLSLTGAASVVGAGIMTAAGGLKQLGAAALTGIGTLTAEAKLTLTGAISAIGAGILTAGGKLTLGAQATMTGIGTLVCTPFGGITHLAEAVLTGIGTLTVSGSRAVTGTLSVVGVGTLGVLGKLTVSTSAVLTGIGNLTVSGGRLVTGAASTIGAGILTVGGKLNQSVQAILTGIGTLTVEGRELFAGASSMVGVGLLTVGGTITGVAVAVKTIALTVSLYARTLVSKLYDRTGIAKFYSRAVDIEHGERAETMFPWVFPITFTGTMPTTIKTKGRTITVKLKVK